MSGCATVLGTASNSSSSSRSRSSSSSDNISQTTPQQRMGFSSPVVVQAGIISYSMYHVLQKCSTQACGPTLAVVAISLVAQAVRCHQFELVYLLALPFSLSTLYNDKDLLLNAALSLDVLPATLLLQLSVLLHRQLQLRSVMAILLNHTINYILKRVGDLKSLDAVDCNLFSILLTNILFLIDSDSVPFHVLKYTLLSFILVLAINYCLVQWISKSRRFLRSGLLLFVHLFGFPLFVQLSLSIDGSSPFPWLLKYIASSQTRKTILATWLLALVVLVPNLLLLKSNLSLNTSRKVWHFFIILLIVYPFQKDPLFIKIALAGTIVLFLSVEYIRYLKLEPVGQYLDSQLRLFADFRDDRGPIIISYIYLIVGVSAPLLLHDSPVGLISLGLGDSMASIIGGKWGKHRWPGTTKTIEGTVAFFVSTYLACLVLQSYLGYFANASKGQLLWICAITAVLEGNSILNDNILIPAFMLIMEEICISI